MIILLTIELSVVIVPVFVIPLFVNNVFVNVVDGAVNVAVFTLDN